jgi:RNA recognition motif-containing protein
MDSGRFNLEDTVLRRTVHIANVPPSIEAADLLDALTNCGVIEKVHFDQAHDQPSQLALIQFADENGAFEAMKLSTVYLIGHPCRVSQSRITIDVIPPTDAVFGKPLTVGRHVMSVNPSVHSGSTVARRERAFEKACQRAAHILDEIAGRTNAHVPDSEIRRLRDSSARSDFES